MREKQTTTPRFPQSLARDVCLGKCQRNRGSFTSSREVDWRNTLPSPPERAEGSLKNFEFSSPAMELRWQGLADARTTLFVSGRFAMIYVVDAKFFESTAGDADRCLKSPPGVVRAGARVKSPEPVMRRLPRRKVK